MSVVTLQRRDDVTQFLRLKEVQARTGLSRSSIYRRVAIGAFPKPIPLGSPHAIGFLAEEVEDWAQAQVRLARGDTDKPSV